MTHRPPRRGPLTGPLPKYIPLAALALLLATACSPAPADTAAPATAHASTPGVAAAADTALRLPLQDFIVAFHTTSLASGHVAASTYQFPAIWLYAPDGRLHSEVTDEAGLEQLREAFATLDPASAPGAGLTLDAVTGLIEESSGSDVASTGSGRWTALVFESEDACDEPPCPAFVGTVEHLKTIHPESLRAIHVTLVQ